MRSGQGCHQDHVVGTGLMHGSLLVKRLSSLLISRLQLENILKTCPVSN